jgi:hypothetical protein
LASVTVNNREKSVGNPDIELANVTAAADGDTFTSKFGTVLAAFSNDQTTKGGSSCTVSGRTVTIACTAGNTLDLIIIGRE